ncbi:hypothetical protein ACTSEZ_02200 [Metabacillus sp. JX24]|uniref:hypothetical protein n=1 Tax=Metabacillus sp. JX24 TaxID=3240759 RepID=UPI00350EE2BF
MGDIITSIGPLLFFIIFIIFIILPLIFIIRYFKRMEKRAEERLKLERDHAAFQQKQVKVNEELNQRLTSIEKMLKEVE